MTLEPDRTPASSRRAPLLVAAFLMLALAASSLALAGPSAAPPYSGPEGGLPTSYPIDKIKPKQGNVSIAFQVVAPNEANTSMAAAAKAEARRLGIKLSFLYNNVSIDKQITDFNQIIVQKPSGTIFFVLDPKALRPILANVKRAGVITLAMDAVLPGEKLQPNIDSTIVEGVDHTAYLQVKEMARLRPHGKIVIIGLGLPVAHLVYRDKRVAYWAKQFGLTVLGNASNPSDDQSGGERAMNGLLGRFPQIDGVIAYNDPTAVGANAAALGQGRKVVAIGANGGSEARAAIQRGRMAATVQLDFMRMAVQAIDAIYLKVTQPKVKLPPVVYRPPTLVNRENMGGIQSWDAQIKELERKAK
jgi:ribose transport system substrate-binding protein